MISLMLATAVTSPILESAKAAPQFGDLRPAQGCPAQHLGYLAPLTLARRTFITLLEITLGMVPREADRLSSSRNCLQLGVPRKLVPSYPSSRADARPRRNPGRQ